MARKRRINNLAAAALLAVILGAGCRGVSPGVPDEDAGAGPSLPPETLYTQAEALLEAGQYTQALTLLAAVPREEIIPPDYYLLQGRIASAQGRPDRARYYLRHLSGHAASSPAVVEGLVLLADLCYRNSLAASAFGYYLEAVNRFSPVMAEREKSRIHLRLASLALYERGDRGLSGEFLSQVAPALLADEDARDYGMIRKLLAWRTLNADRLGVRDGNISALATDGDDLWIGTWNGGVIRYSLSGDRLEIFRHGEASLDANTVRTIKAYDGRIWVGSYRGLFSYSRATGAWSEQAIFGGPEPMRVEVLEEAGGLLYAGTLGRGLWRLQGRRWEQVPGLAGAYVNALCLYDGKLALGTMKQGILFFDPESGAVRSFDEISPDLEARNITLLLPDPTGSLWIGTYGSGLYVWQPAAGRLRHYSSRRREIPDDWVLAGTLGEGGSYFGTFGGGVIHFASPASDPGIIGLREGLPSLDISAACSSPPFIYFGTLGAGVVIHDAQPGN